VGIEKIAAFLAHGDLVVEFSLAAHHRRVFALMQAYRGVPMSLADASVWCAWWRKGLLASCLPWTAISLFTVSTGTSRYR
jgi:hypothetical protein